MPSATAGGWCASSRTKAASTRWSSGSPRSGAVARARAGAYLDAHRRAEFDIPGVTFGGRYHAQSVFAAVLGGVPARPRAAQPARR
jgi:hypothetical protein